MKKHKITILPELRSADVPAGITLLAALDSMGIAVDSPCGGRGICGKCLIKTSGSHTSGELLACRCIVEDDITLSLPKNKAGKITFAAGAKKTEDPLAFAIDIGTTAVEISALSLSSGKNLASASFMNPQRHYGYDVISRIAAAKKPELRGQMTNSIRTAVMAAIDEILEGSGTSPALVKQIVIAGNTAMTCLFAGLDISPLGVYPYSVPQTDFEQMRAKDLGLELPNAALLLLPSASAYIGGDITGALALIDSMNIKERVFFADIGTNGEMFLKDGKNISALSCAMGPALEGMNISMGMTASEGAVIHAALHGAALLAETAGSAAPVGFAGTGIIDIIALLLKSGIIGKDGAFNTNHPVKFSNAGFTQNGFTLAGKLTVKQEDIRTIQLSKAAFRSSSAILLSEAGVEPEDVELLVIAGSLGANLNIGNFKTLGFLPPFVNAKNLLTGNTSLAAALRCCVEPDFYSRIIELRDSMRVIETADYAGFDELFIKSLDFI
ncbi:MAG: ASKHA domain-containing protein [Spirochaetia bacterium]|jgi:uncharacterized 2Fe-2S/4Fe-4S cluster protein (DUF4445 family)|nr:ASKHA domain-containing protein [Spirochaetia bacterium]